MHIYNNRLLQCTTALHGLPVLDYLKKKKKIRDQKGMQIILLQNYLSTIRFP